MRATQQFEGGMKPEHNAGEGLSFPDERAEVAEMLVVRILHDVVKKTHCLVLYSSSIGHRGWRASPYQVTEPRRVKCLPSGS